MDFMFDLPEELSFLTKPSTPSPAKAEENNESDRYSPSRITPDDDNLDTEDNDSKQSISNNSLEHSADLGGFSLADEIISAAASGSFCPEAEEQLPPSSTSALTSELLPETNVEINALDGLAILESILSTTDVINTSKKLEVVESVEKNRFKPVFTQRSLDVESNKKSSILDDIEKQEISIVENVKNIELKTSESKPTESDKPSSRVLSLLPKLGKSEAKKRLLAFSGKTSFGLKAKAVKSSPFVEEENVLGGANLQSPSVNAVDDSEQLVKDEKKDLTKKKNKKTATLSNMEQIRSEETRLKEALGLKNVPFSSLENGVYHMAQFLDNPEALKKLERQSRHMEQKIEKYRQYTMRNALKDKPKDLEMEEKRHKPKRLPRSWKEFREEKFTYEMLHKMKLDRSHSRSRSRSRDRRSRPRSRSRERRGRSGSRDRHRGRGSPGRSHRRSPHMLFPIKARPGFNSTTRKEYPGQFIRFSKTRPKITYSINPNKFSRAYDNRIFVLRNAVREERHIMEKFLVLPNSCEMNSKKSFDQQSWFKPMQDWVNDKVDEAPVVSKWDSEENLDVQDTKTSTKAGKKDKEKKTEKLDTVKPELEVKVESESEKLNDKDDESLNLNSEYEAFMQMVSKDKDEVEVKLEKGKEFQIKNLPQASNKEDREKLKNNAKVDEMDKKNAKKLEKKKKKEEKKQKKQAKKEKKEKKKRN